MGLSKTFGKLKGKFSRVKVEEEGQTSNTDPRVPSPNTATSPPDVNQSTSRPSQNSKNTSNHVASSSASTAAAATAPQDLEFLRDATWQMACKRLFAEQRELMVAYESLVKDANGIDQSQDLNPATMAQVVAQQRAVMENKQWRYMWFGHERTVRDTVETIFGVVQQASGLISAGMTAAPPYVSLPWSMIAVLVPFIVKDVTAVRGAGDGLKEVTDLMARHSYAEREFLLHEQTRADFQAIVLPLYTSILEYQASVAIYFAKSTMERLGSNLKPKNSWTDALAATKKLADDCSRPLADLSTRLTQLGFTQVRDSLRDGQLLLQRIADTVGSQRARREQIQRWISPIEPFNYHGTVRSQLGRDYFDSGKWFLEDQNDFLKWRSSKRDVLLLQGIVGSGKSSISSMVVENLFHGADGRVIFVYCSASTAAGMPLNTSQTPGILRSLLAQLAVKLDGSISPTVQALYERDGGASSYGALADITSVVALMQAVLQEESNEQLSVVIDALDECEDYDDVLGHVASLHATHARMRVFLSARFGVMINSRFAVFTHVSVETKNEADILSYVQREVSGRYRQLGMTDDQSTRLIKALNRLAGGMFRWVELALAFYLPSPKKQRRKLAPADIERRLHKLEESQSTPIDRLMDTYEDLWHMALGDEDEASTRAAVTSTMKWVLCSFRPLKVGEVLSALHAHSGDQFDEELLLERCSNLVLKDSNGHMRVAHLSVKQFFEERLSTVFNPRTQHLHAAMCSLQVVITFRTGEGIFRKNHATNDMEESTAQSGVESFILYCRLHWAQHYRLAEQDSELEQLLAAHRHLLDRPFGNFIQWVTKRLFSLTDSSDCGPVVDISSFIENMTVQKLRHKLIQGDPDLSSPLARLMQCQVADDVNFRWLSAFADSNRSGSMEIGLNPPLYVRGVMQQTTTLRWSNADELHVCDADSHGNTVLHYASELDYLDHIRPLIQRGALLERNNLQGETALRVAARAASVDSYLELIKCGASQSVEDLACLPTASLRDFMQQESTPINAAVPVPMIRPSLTITQAHRKCRTCDLSAWLEASLDGNPARFRINPDESVHCFLCQSAHYLQNETAGRNGDGTVDLEIKVIFDAESNFRAGRDVVKFKAQNAADLEYEIYAAPSGSQELPQQAMSMFRGRSVQGNLSETLRAWMEDCRSHAECEMQLRSPILPTRLIDLRSTTPRLCVSAEIEQNRDLRYVFLSHTWGVPGLTTVLLRHNLQQLRVGLDMATLPERWRQAMLLARDTGYHFIFIDALCIIQDDAQDEILRETSSIPSYVAHAAIVFATRNDGGHNHLDPRPSADVCEPVIARLPGIAAPFEIRLRKPLQTAGDVMRRDVLARCWRQSEVLLTKRVVIFGREQLYWSCAHGLASQGDSQMVSAPWVSVPKMREQRRRRVDCFSPGAIKNADHRYWYYLAEITSQGQLTYPPDRLAAFNTLATEVLREIGPDQHHAGLLQSSLAHGLLWIEMGDKEQTYPYQDSAMYCGPTWSWLSASRGVSYGLVPGLQDALKRYQVPEHCTFDQLCSAAQDGPLLPHFSVRVKSVMLSASATNRVSFRDFSCFFDAEKGGDVTKMDDANFVAIAPWSPGPRQIPRWAGLIIRRETREHYVRLGVFLGPSCDDDLSMWKMKTVTLY